MTRDDWDREIRRLAPEILRDPVACALVHIAETVFAGYEARLRGEEPPAADLERRRRELPGRLMSDPVAFDRRMLSDDLIRDLGGDPRAQGLT